LELKEYKHLLFHLELKAYMDVLRSYGYHLDHWSLYWIDATYDE
jgi:hypothetical protein